MRRVILGATVVAAACALLVGSTAATGQVLPAARCFFAASQPPPNHVVVTATAADPLSLRISWVTSQYGNMVKFLKSQQIAWTITTATNTYTDDITSFGDTRYWTTPVQTTVNGAGVWSTTFTAPTGVVLGGRPPAGGPGEAATLTFSILSDKKVYDDGGQVYTPAPGTNVLSSATCTIEGL
jgi:hypothetical protein